MENRYLWKSAVIALVILGFLLVSCSPASPSISEPTRTPESSPTASPPEVTMTVEPSPTEDSVLVETVTFTTQDDVTIAGTLYGSGSVAIILAHQGTPGADQTTWRPFARLLAERGFTALTFDFRGVGQSEGPLSYEKLGIDVKAATGFLQARGYTQIVCAGASMGGTACILNATDEEYLGLIILASTLRAGVTGDNLSITDETLAQLVLPKLFIVAEYEYYIVVRDMEHMVELSPEPKNFIVLSESLHGTSLFNTDSAELLTTSMLEFLDGLRNNHSNP